MIKLDDNLLVELGLSGLPKEEKTAFLKHMYETLEMRVGTKLAEKMSDAQMTEFELFINSNDEQGAFHWLEANFPNYKDVVAAEFETLKVEVKPLAAQILASSTAHSQQTQQTQQTQQPQQAQPMPAGPVAPVAPAYQQPFDPSANAFAPAQNPAPAPPAAPYPQQPMQPPQPQQDYSQQPPAVPSMPPTPMPPPSTTPPPQYPQPVQPPPYNPTPPQN
jgi:hypothetical protein